MSYAVKELFYSLQGEGAQSGRAAVFCRFSGCNLWSGREAHRAAAVCRFCDTDFVAMDGPGGGRYGNADALAAAVADAWPGGGRPLAVLTGGEPLLQLDAALLEALHARGFEAAVESNGTRPAPPGIDWLCVSPKGKAPLVITAGDELKLVYPQQEAEAQPERFAALAFDHFFLQPMDGPHYHENLRRCLDYCLAHPQWRLSLQTHKVLGIP